LSIQFGFELTLLPTVLWKVGVRKKDSRALLITPFGIEAFKAKFDIIIDFID
jgi:hypothetical protein